MDRKVAAQPSRFPNGTGFWGFGQRVLASSFRNRSSQFKWVTMCFHTWCSSPHEPCKNLWNKNTSCSKQCFYYCFSPITKESLPKTLERETASPLDFSVQIFAQLFKHQILQFLGVLLIKCSFYILHVLFFNKSSSFHKCALVLFNIKFRNF